jgi:hypothetical protein
MSDHTHSDVDCPIPEVECKVFAAVEIVCNDWDRETRKREIQRTRGYKAIHKILAPLWLKPEIERAIMDAYFESHQRPTIRNGKIPV